MKSTVSILSVALALGFGLIVASPAQAGESVYSVNIVGFQTKELPEPGQFDMISAPFDKDENTLEDVLGGLLIGNAVEGGADRLRFWDADQQVYVNVGVGPDGNFYLQDAQGNWVEPFEQVNFELVRGEGLWLAASAAGPSERSITLAGDVVMDDEVLYQFFEGFHLVANPFSTPIALQDMMFAESDASGNAVEGAADRVRAWSTVNQQYQNYGLGPDGKWYKQDSSGNWQDPFVEAEKVFEPGEAFFYFAQDDFDWILENPYAAALND